MWNKGQPPATPPSSPPRHAPIFAVGRTSPGGFVPSSARKKSATPQTDHAIFSLPINNSRNRARASVGFIVGMRRHDQHSLSREKLVPQLVYHLKVLLGS